MHMGCYSGVQRYHSSFKDIIQVLQYRIICFYSTGVINFSSTVFFCIIKIVYKTDTVTTLETGVGTAF